MTGHDPSDDGGDLRFPTDAIGVCTPDTALKEALTWNLRTADLPEEAASIRRAHAIAREAVERAIAEGDEG